MGREEILNKYYEDDKILAAHILDQIRLAKTRNQIVATDFLDMYKQRIAKEVLNISKENNYIFYTKYEELEKAVLIIYPEKYERLFYENKYNYSDVIKVIRINLPNELKGKYSHRDYLSGIMKLGIKREKIGDIIVFEDGADIIVKSDVCEYVFQNLKTLLRFSKAKFEVVDLEKLRKPQIKKELKRITVSSLRIDNIVPEIANCSRSDAANLIKEQRVFVNYENELRNSRLVKVDDVIVIRGKGKYKITNIEGETKKGKIALNIEHYI